MILEQAQKIVEERGRKYGHPSENFKRTAQILNAMNFRLYDAKDNAYRMVEASDIPIMMICVKMAREANEHQDDNILDIAGYIDAYDKAQERQIELL